MSETLSVRGAWLTELAALCYPQAPGQAMRAFRAYMPMLADMPDGAFTDDSLEIAATAPRRMAIPSYDEVRKPLSAWWRENFPRERALPAPREPDRAPPTADEVAAVTARVQQALSGLRQTDEPVVSAPADNYPSKPLSDGVLLAIHRANIQEKQDAPSGSPEWYSMRLSAIRVEMLERKLGLRERAA